MSTTTSATESEDPSRAVVQAAPAHKTGHKKGKGNSNPPSSEPPSPHPLVQLLRESSAHNAASNPNSQNAPGASLLRLLSPFRQSFEELGFLGRGGFGSVIRARHVLDGRVLAIKRIPFRSPVAPWNQTTEVEKGPLSKFLKEIRALCRMEKSPYVTRYFWAWTEPDFQKLSGVLNRPQDWTNPMGMDDATDDQDEDESGSYESDESGSDDTPSQTAPLPPTPSQSFGIDFRGDSAATSAQDSPSMSYAPGPAKKATQVAKNGVNKPSRFAAAPAPAFVRPPLVNRPGILVEEMSTTTEGLVSSSSDCSDSEDVTESESGTRTRRGKKGKELVPVMLPTEGASDYPYFLYISMEVVEGPTLDRWMAARTRVPASQEAEAEVAIFRSLMKALLHVHAHGIIHRDIKPSNIFVVGEGRNLRVVIGDFGLSVLFEGPDAVHLGLAQAQADLHRTTGIGTASYCAPEQMQGPGLYGCRVDLFPCGLILIELFTKLTTGMERARVLQDARNGFLPAHLWNMYPEIGDLATRLLFSDPGSRITAAQALEHPALTDRIFEGVSEEGTAPASASGLASPATASVATTTTNATANRGGGYVVETPSSVRSAATVTPKPLIVEVSELSTAGTASSASDESGRSLVGAMPADPFENGPVFAVDMAEWAPQVVQEMTAAALSLGFNLALVDTGNAAPVPHLTWGARYPSLEACRESLAPSTTWCVSVGGSAASPSCASEPLVWPWELVSGCFDGRNVLVVLVKDGPARLKKHARNFFSRAVALRSASPAPAPAPMHPLVALSSLWSAAQGLRTCVLSRANLLSSASASGRPVAAFSTSPFSSPVKPAAPKPAPSAAPPAAKRVYVEAVESDSDLSNSAPPAAAPAPVPPTVRPAAVITPTISITQPAAAPQPAATVTVLPTFSINVSPTVARGPGVNAGTPPAVPKVVVPSFVVTPSPPQPTQQAQPLSQPPKKAQSTVVEIESDTDC